MSDDDVPRRAVTRTAKLAGLPIGYAGRAALGLGKRIGGRSAEIVAAGDPAAHGRTGLPGPGRAQGRGDEDGAGPVHLRSRAAPGDRRAVPGHADQAAGVARRRCPPGPCTRCWSRTWARTGGTTSPSSTTSRWRPRPSARCTRPPGGTVSRSRSRSSTRGRPRDRQRLQPAGPDRTAVRRADAGAGREAAAGRAAHPGGRRARLRDGGGKSQQAFADAYRGDPDIFVPDVVTATEHVLVPAGWTARRWPRSSATAPRTSGTGPASCWPGSCSPGRPGPGCCTPTRTRATSGCWTTGGWACSTSARWTTCRTGCRRSSAGCCA